MTESRLNIDVESDGVPDPDPDVGGTPNEQGDPIQDEDDQMGVVPPLPLKDDGIVRGS